MSSETDFNKLSRFDYQEDLNVYVEVLYGGKMPEKKHENDAGWDVFSPKDFSLKYFEHIKLGLKIKLDIPKGYYYDLRPKSSLNAFPVLTQLGLIDEPYVGELAIVMVNLSDNILKIKAHEKIGQLVLNKNYNEKMRFTNAILKNTERGEGGFGSTGRF